MRPTTAICLHAGCGSITLALQQQHIQIIAAAEPDPDTAATHRRLTNCDTIPTTQVDTTGPADIVIGSPGTHPRWQERIDAFVSTTLGIAPSIAIYFAHRDYSHGHNNRAQRLQHQQALQANGYQVRTWYLDTSDYGIPQRKKLTAHVVIRCPQDHTINTIPVPPLRDLVSVRDVLAERHDSFAQSPQQPLTLTTSPTLHLDPYRSDLFTTGAALLDPNHPAPPFPSTLTPDTLPVIDQATLARPTRTPWVDGYIENLHRGLPAGGRAPARLRTVTIDELSMLAGFRPQTPWAGDSGSVIQQITHSVPPAVAQAVVTAATTLITRLDAAGIGRRSADR